MIEENPYESPHEKVLLCSNCGREASGSASPSILLWTIGSVFTTAFLGGIFGALIGAARGSLTPDYSRSVCIDGDSPTFDPLSAGISLGLTQGLVLGTFVGLSLVLMFFWHNSRTEE